MSSNHPFEGKKRVDELERQNIKLPSRISKDTDLSLFVRAGLLPPRPLAYAYAATTNGGTCIVVSRPPHDSIRSVAPLSQAPVQSRLKSQPIQRAPSDNTRLASKPIQKAPSVKNHSASKPMQMAPSQKNAKDKARPKAQQSATLFSYPQYSQEQVRAAIVRDFKGYVGNIYQQGLDNSRGTCEADCEKDAMKDVNEFRSINLAFVPK